MRALPGELLKRQPKGATTLIPSVQYRHLTAHLQDLIIIAYERSTNLRGRSLSLEKLEYVSAVENAGKFSMRLNVLVKDHEADAAIPLSLTFTADTEELLCSAQY